MQGSLEPSSSFTDQQYEELVNEAIAYVKGGQRDRARRLLERATLIPVPDARAWLWLSATTDDPQEQRNFLEHAVGADPSNAAARRGLVMLTEKMKKEKVLAEGEAVPSRLPQEPQAVQAQTYLCPQCGGSLRYNPQAWGLKCTNCGTVQAKATQAGVEHLEQVMDFTLPTERGHRWAEGLQQIACEQCGAVSLLPPGQAADRCAYCGSNRLVKSAQQQELVEPQAIGLAKVEEQEARERVKAWLGKGWFVPDDLKDNSERLQLRVAYYPFWTFDGMIELSWTCEVNEGTSRSPHWVSRNGVEMQFFDDVLVPGLRKMSMAQLNEIEPFELKEMVAFAPEYLAGWSALNYDHAMADASLRGERRWSSACGGNSITRSNRGRKNATSTAGAVNGAA